MARKKKVLVVDDESPIAEMISEFCESFGYETRIMTNGESVLAAAETFQPDIITLDIMMPGMSGMDVLKELKMNPQTQNIPVLIISAMSDEDQVKSLLNESHGILAKPLKIKKLKSALDKILP